MTAFLLMCAVMGTDGDPVAILKRADAATQRLERVSYQARAWGEGALSGRIATMEAAVRAIRPASGLPRLHLRATIRNPGSRTARERVVIRGANYVSSTVDGDTTLLDSRVGNARLQPIISAIWMRELAIINPFRDEINADLQRYEGVRSVGGVECHVVYVAYANRRGEARWYIGKHDSLPRRVDRILAGGARVLEITDLDTSPELDPAIFRRKADNADAAATSSGEARP